MDDNASKLMKLQKTHSSESWKELGIVDNFSEYEEKTFARYVSNYSLIKLKPFIDTLNGQRAVTICDGRGHEALYLQEHGLHCTATDLVAVHLMTLKEKGILENIDEQNAEDLSYGDNTFDWGLVKAGLHHLQRPLLGIYELLRVCNKGVIINEANDSWLLNFAKKFSKAVSDFEEAGNYVDRFRKREIEKLCLSLGLPSFALYTYLLPWRSRDHSIINPGWNYSIHVTFYKLLNMLLKSQGNVFRAIIFKERPTRMQIDVLKKIRFRIFYLPKSPYL